MTVRDQPNLLDTLPSQKEPRCPLSGSEDRFGPLGKVINLLPLPGFEPQTVQPVAWSLSSPGCLKVFVAAFLLFKCRTLLLITKENITNPAT